jgi:hypothetical protein
MGKRYKQGNHGKRKPKKNKTYMKREIQINRLIRDFRKILYNNPKSINNYNEAYHLRGKIKYLIDIQSRQIHRKSRRRRNIYYSQISEFKGLYVTWKKITLPVYLKARYDFPEHLIPELTEYYKNVKKGEKPKTNGLVNKVCQYSK